MVKIAQNITRKAIFFVRFLVFFAQKYQGAVTRFVRFFQRLVKCGVKTTVIFFFAQNITLVAIIFVLFEVLFSEK